ncbi:polysaccharide lyase family 1 protein [Amniculicola lignicola CBS 123094]|uniref:pectate lyase n=1 Tax=Amniculicola lignicola CBS 123094 TaxID=1392246 RepID=A0A6A5X2Q8_9PLEO|nr:polysaccharide lyase family 1 protein [Amniculicola lignicola CBS 123094]
MKLSVFLSVGLSTLALAAPIQKRCEDHVTNSTTPAVSSTTPVATSTATPVAIPSSNANTSATGSASLEDGPTTGYATENGGTTGGKGGKQVSVSTLAELTTAVAGDEASIVIITGPISGSGENVKIGSNKSVIGKDSTAQLSGFTLTVKGVSNVIIRNIAVSKVVGGDAIAIQKATNVWVDHVDLSSDRDHDKDYYDGLIDVTHAGDFVTISNSYFHDHWKCSLVGHSDSNGAEDTGFLHITYHNNYWKNINSRGPSFRFGTGHLFNNYYENVSDGINTRSGAQVLVQNNVFVGSKKPLYTVDDGQAVATGNDFGVGSNNAPKGTLTSVPYTVPSMLEAAAVKAAVVGTAGVTLSF